MVAHSWRVAEWEVKQLTRSSRRTTTVSNSDQGSWEQPQSHDMGVSGAANTVLARCARQAPARQQQPLPLIR